MMKHQYGFAVMNTATGGITRKSFWGHGETEEDCKKNAASQARQYAAQKSEENYQKAQSKNRSHYALSRDSYTCQIVGCSLWR